MKEITIYGKGNKVFKTISIIVAIAFMFNILGTDYVLGLQIPSRLDSEGFKLAYDVRYAVGWIEKIGALLETDAPSLDDIKHREAFLKKDLIGLEVTFEAGKDEVLIYIGRTGLTLRYFNPEKLQDIPKGYISTSDYWGRDRTINGHLKRQVLYSDELHRKLITHVKALPPLAERAKEPPSVPPLEGETGFGIKPIVIVIVVAILSIYLIRMFLTGDISEVPSQASIASTPYLFIGSLIDKSTLERIKRTLGLDRLKRFLLSMISTLHPQRTQLSLEPLERRVLLSGPKLADINLPEPVDITVVAPDGVEINVTPWPRGIVVEYDLPARQIGGVIYNYDDPTTTELETVDLNDSAYLIIGFQGDMSRVTVTVSDNLGNEAKGLIGGIIPNIERARAIPVRRLERQGVDSENVVSVRFDLRSGKRPTKGVKGVLEINTIPDTTEIIRTTRPSPIYNNMFILQPEALSIVPVGAEATLTNTDRGIALTYNNGTGVESGVRINFAGTLDQFDSWVFGFSHTGDLRTVPVKFRVSDEAGNELTGWLPVVGRRERTIGIPTTEIESKGIDLSHVNSIYFLVKGAGRKGTLTVNWEPKASRGNVIRPSRTLGPENIPDIIIYNSEEVTGTPFITEVAPLVVTTNIVATESSELIFTSNIPRNAKPLERWAGSGITWPETNDLTGDIIVVDIEKLAGRANYVKLEIVDSEGGKSVAYLKVLKTGKEQIYVVHADQLKMADRKLGPADLSKAQYMYFILERSVGENELVFSGIPAHPITIEPEMIGWPRISPEFMTLATPISVIPEGIEDAKAYIDADSDGFSAILNRGSGKWVGVGLVSIGRGIDLSYLDSFDFKVGGTMDELRVTIEDIEGDQVFFIFPGVTTQDQYFSIDSETLTLFDVNIDKISGIVFAIDEEGTHNLEAILREEKTPAAWGGGFIQAVDNTTVVTTVDGTQIDINNYREWFRDTNAPPDWPSEPSFNHINVSPYAYDEGYTRSFSPIIPGQEAKLSDGIARRYRMGIREPEDTLPDFLVKRINGEIVRLTVTYTGVNPIGWPQYDVSFITPELQEGNNELFFLSIYGDNALLGRKYFVYYSPDNPEAQTWAQFNIYSGGYRVEPYTKLTFIGEAGEHTRDTNLPEGAEVVSTGFESNELFVITTTDGTRYEYSTIPIEEVPEELPEEVSEEQPPIETPEGHYGTLEINTYNTYEYYPNGNLKKHINERRIEGYGPVETNTYEYYPSGNLQKHEKETNQFITVEIYNDSDFTSDGIGGLTEEYQIQKQYGWVSGTISHSRYRDFYEGTEQPRFEDAFYIDGSLYATYEYDTWGNIIPIPAALGEGSMRQVEDGTYVVTTPQGTVINAGDYATRIRHPVTPTLSIDYTINVEPPYAWVGYPYEPSLTSTTLVPGEEATFGGLLSRKRFGSKEPKSTIPDFLIVNGAAVRMTAKYLGPDPLGQPLYNMTFTVPELREGMNEFLFLSIHPDEGPYPPVLLGGKYSVYYSQDNPESQTWNRYGTYSTYSLANVKVGAPAIIGESGESDRGLETVPVATPQKDEENVFERMYKPLEAGGLYSIFQIMALLNKNESKKQKELSQEELDKFTYRYIDLNEGVLGKISDDGAEPVLIRVPMESLQGLPKQEKSMWLNALSSSPNVYVELYYVTPGKTVSSQSYIENGLEYRAFPVEKRSKKNTVTLFAIARDTNQRDLQTAIKRNGNSIIVPLGIEGDPTGIIRGAFFGLRLIRIARNPEDREFIDETIKGYEGLISSYNIPIHPEHKLEINDILALTREGVNINEIFHVLMKIIASLPIRAISETYEIFRYATQRLAEAA